MTKIEQKSTKLSRKQRIYVFENEGEIFKVVSSKKKAYEYLRKSSKTSYQTFANKTKLVKQFSFFDTHKGGWYTTIAEHLINKINARQKVYIMSFEYKNENLLYNEIISIETNLKKAWKTFVNSTHRIDSSYSTFCKYMQEARHNKKANEAYYYEEKKDKGRGVVIVREFVVQ